MNYFINNLTYLTRQKNIPEREPASKLGIPEPQYEQILQGLLEPSLDQVIQIGQYFGVSLDRLLCEDLSDIQENVPCFNCRFLALDVDGVLTDGGMYFTETGDEFKKFNTKDGMAIKKLISKGIPVAFISSGYKKTIIENRAKLLGVEYVYTGQEQKLGILQNWCAELGVSPAEVGYIGDDINDLGIMRSGVFAACPADAVQLVKAAARVVLQLKGGEGCVREFADRFIFTIT